MAEGQEVGESRSLLDRAACRSQALLALELELSPVAAAVGILERAPQHRGQPPKFLLAASRNRFESAAFRWGDPAVLPVWFVQAPGAGGQAASHKSYEGMQFELESIHEPLSACHGSRCHHPKGKTMHKLSLGRICGC